MRKGLKSYAAKKKQFLTKFMMRKRLIWCKQHQTKNIEFWKKVIFSDESMIDINASSYAMYRIRRYSDSNPLSHHYIRQQMKHPLKLMIWGSFSFSGLNELKIITGYMNSAKYIEILNECILPIFENDKNAIYQDDNAPCHTSKMLKQWYRTNKITKLDWPSNSPDLNPIENLWHFMKRRIIKRTPRTKSQLEAAIIDVWKKEIPIEYLQRLIESMPRRIKAVIKNKGAWIKY